MLDIITKEVRCHMLGARWLIFVLANVLLFGFACWIFTYGYDRQMRSYDQIRNLEQERLVRSREADFLYAHFFQVMRPPDKLGFVGPEDRSLPEIIMFSVNDPSLLRYSYGMNYNFALPRFLHFDWSFAVLFVLSFCSIMLGYDSITGERESGTLKLVLSNAISRWRVVTGKAAANAALLLISLLLSAGLGTLLVSTGIDGILTGANLLNLAAWCMGAWLVLLVYLSISILGSCVCRSSNVSLYLSLCFWVLFAIAIPNGARLAAQYANPIRTDIETHLIQVSRAPFTGRSAQIYDDQINTRFKQARLGMYLSRFSPNGIANELFVEILGNGFGGFESWVKDVARIAASVAGENVKSLKAPPMTLARKARGAVATGTVLFDVSMEILIALIFLLSGIAWLNRSAIA
jgi:ABC-type transport system involved in multi-copper enzyme maturation permease subunit